LILDEEETEVQRDGHSYSANIREFTNESKKGFSGFSHCSTSIKGHLACPNRLIKIGVFNSAISLSLDDHIFSNGIWQWLYHRAFIYYWASCYISYHKLNTGK
jgi:hypothetical protein